MHEIPHNIVTIHHAALFFSPGAFVIWNMVNQKLKQVEWLYVECTWHLQQGPSGPIKLEVDPFVQIQLKFNQNKPNFNGFHFGTFPFCHKLGIHCKWEMTQFHFQ